MLALGGDGGLRPVPGEDHGVIGQYHELVSDTIHQFLVAAAREVCSAYAKIEQGIPREDHPMPVKGDPP